jgi:hypothetical protein
MVSQAKVHIEVEGNMQLKDVDMICLQLEKEILSHFAELEKISSSAFINQRCCFYLFSLIQEMDTACGKIFP